MGDELKSTLTHQYIDLLYLFVASDNGFYV